MQKTYLAAKYCLYGDLNSNLKETNGCSNENQIVVYKNIICILTYVTKYVFTFCMILLFNYMICFIKLYYILKILKNHLYQLLHKKQIIYKKLTLVAEIL